MTSPTTFDGAALQREVEELRALDWTVEVSSQILERPRLLDWVDLHDVTGDLITIQSGEFGVILEKKPSSFGYQPCNDHGRWLGPMIEFEGGTMVPRLVADGLREAVRADHFEMKRHSRGTFSSASGRAVLSDGSSGIFIWDYKAVDSFDIHVTVPEMAWEPQFDDRWFYTPKQLLVLLWERLEILTENEDVKTFRAEWADRCPKVEVGRCREERYEGWR